MASHHRVSIIALVGLIAIIGLASFFVGSPQTGLAPAKSNYLTTSAGRGEDVAIEAAKTCYPIKDKFETYRVCCSQPCIDECKAQDPTGDIRVCQSVCQEDCTKIITSIFLKKRPGFVGKATTMGSANQYVIYEK